jgi:CheY-like chemotaxis protein
LFDDKIGEKMAKILVADDDSEIRLLIKRTLEKEGHSIVEATDGVVAIELFKEQVFDLAIIDIIMPKKEGIRTILELKQLKPNIRIVAISGGGFVKPESYLATAEAFGAECILTKPFNASELSETVNNLLNKIDD